MRVSVLLSSFNGEDYIVEQLNSIKNQTMRIDEVVIVDDCSTDRTVEYANRFIVENNLLDSWKIYQNEINKGWKQNFIDGIKLTTGDFIFFSDQDDFWFQDKVEIVVSRFIEHPDISVIATGETLWTGESVDSYKSTISGENFPRFYDKENNFLIHCSGCTMGIRRSYYKKIIKYYCDGWAHDDFFWKMGIVDESLLLLKGSTILHRIHGKNESRKKRDKNSTVKGLKDSIFICDHIISYLSSNLIENDSKDRNLRILHCEKSTAQLRLELIEEKKYYLFFALLFRLRSYRRRRQLIGDLLLAVDLKIH